MGALTITVVRTGDVLRPSGRLAEEGFAKIREKKPVIISVEQPRNPKHHRKLYGVATRVAENDPRDEFADADDAIEWVKMHTRSMIREYHLADGGLVIKTKSICWASMKQAAFNEFYERAIDLWSRRLGTDPETLRKEGDDG